MTVPREDLLADINLEVAATTRWYFARVTSVEQEEASGLLRVGFRGNRALDGVRDRLEGGRAQKQKTDADVESTGRGAGTWIVHQVGDERGEAAVLYLLPEDDGDLAIGDTLFLRLFPFVKAIRDVLSADVPRWNTRTEQVLDWLTGDVVPARSRVREHVFRQSLDAAWNAQLGFVWGPPGTGKTWTLGQQVAEVAGPGTRILVVSTTNSAADLAAAEIMRALKQRGKTEITVKRVGSGLERTKFTKPSTAKFDHPEVVPEDDPAGRISVPTGSGTCCRGLGMDALAFSSIRCRPPGVSKWLTGRRCCPHAASSIFPNPIARLDKSRTSQRTCSRFSGAMSRR